MSSEATAYVTALVKCPDGAEITYMHKAPLWCLADHHNRSTRRCDPSQPLLMREVCMPESTLKRALTYCEEHCVIERIYPAKQGRGKYCNYLFLELDAPDKLARKLAALAKGVTGGPLFSAGLRGPEGVQRDAERGSEGVQRVTRYKEEPRTKGNLEPSTAKAASLPPSDANGTKRALRTWFDLKDELARDLPTDEVKLWLAPARLLALLTGNTLLVALPPSNRIIKAAQARLPKLRELAKRAGYHGVGLTKYPDQDDREEIRRRYPLFYETRVYGGAHR